MSPTDLEETEKENKCLKKTCFWYSVDILFIQILQENWVLAESRMLYMRVVSLSINSHEQSQ